MKYSNKPWSVHLPPPSSNTNPTVGQTLWLRNSPGIHRTFGTWRRPHTSNDTTGTKNEIPATWKWNPWLHYGNALILASSPAMNSFKQMAQSENLPTCSTGFYVSFRRELRTFFLRPLFASSSGVGERPAARLEIMADKRAARMLTKFWSFSVRATERSAVFIRRAMAVIFLCSSILLRPDSAASDRRPSTSTRFLRRSSRLGNTGYVHFKVKKLFLSLGNAAKEKFEAHLALLGRESMPTVVHDVKTSISNGTCVGPTQPDDDTTPEGLVAHQVAHQVMVLGRSPALALIIVNALMFSAPFEALAETCEADKSIFNMPLLLFVALIGATVGGLVARQRKGELKRLNEQLRQINAALRRQAKIESYAPTLSYAPAVGRVPENEVIVDPRKHELISHLKSGKNFLRNQDPDKAFVEFKTALELAQSLADPTEEKKAARGLGASLQRQGKFREAIKYHSMVLAISEREGEDSGNTEAYGAIADCYTELGDLERAGIFYDKYISLLQAD